MPPKAGRRAMKADPVDSLALPGFSAMSTGASTPSWLDIDSDAPVSTTSKLQHSEPPAEEPPQDLAKKEETAVMPPAATPPPITPTFEHVVVEKPPALPALEVSFLSSGDSAAKELEEELSQMDRDIASVYQEMERDSAHEKQTLAHLNQQKAEALQQKETAQAEKASLAAYRAEKINALESEKERRKKDAREVVRSSTNESVQETLATLQSSINRVRAEVSILELEHTEVTKELAATAGGQLKESAISQMSSMVENFIGSLRGTFNSKVKGIVASQTRSAASEVVEDHRRSQQRSDQREERIAAMRLHQKGRLRAFEEFRASRKEARRSTSENLFATLKNQRMKHLENLRQSGRDATQEKDRKIALELHQSRAELQSSIERVVKRQREALAEQEAAFSTRERCLHERLETDSSHHEKIFETEKNSLFRMMQQEQQQVMGITSGDSRQTILLGGDFDAHLSALQSKLQSLNEEAILSTQTVAVHKSLPSETQRLIGEREAIVEELRKTIIAQRDSLDREWLRFQSLLSAISSNSEAFSASAQQGRAALQNAQQRVDYIRTNWEKQVRSQLASTSCATEILSRDEVTSEVIMSLCASLRRLMSRQKELSEARSAYNRKALVLSEESALKHEDLAQLNLKVLSRYEELSKLVASIETRQEHLQLEASDVERAKGILEMDKEEFKHAAQTLQQASERLQLESQVVALSHKENMDRLGFAVQLQKHRQRANSPASKYRKYYSSSRFPMSERSSLTGGDAFRSLVQLSEDGTLPPNSGFEEPAAAPPSSGPRRNSLTTPSPETE